MANTIGELLLLASDKIGMALRSNVNDAVTPRLDAEVLLSHVIGKDRSYLFAWPEKNVSEEHSKVFELLVGERVKGVPVAYLVGSQEFWSMLLTVTPDTLIPRAETEQLVDFVLGQHGQREGLRLLDAGTGSGAIALALAGEKKSWQVDACDISDSALDVARRNATNHNPAVRFFKSDWLCGVMPESYDLIVSNPPYIAESDQHLAALANEPRSALVAGADGLDDIRILVRQSSVALKPGGFLYVEHGYNQGLAVRRIFLDAGFDLVASEKDYAGHERFSHGVIRGVIE